VIGTGGRCAIAWLLALGAGGCASPSNDGAGDEAPACQGAKCDDVDEASTGGTGETGEADTDTDTGEIGEGTVEEICDARRMDALAEGRLALSRDELRWSCADTPGTPAEERGQEYCEYFAMVQLPGAEASTVHGMLLGADFDAGRTGYGIELSDADIAALEAEPEAVVGQCVFTAWNADMAPACGTDCEDAPAIFDRRVDDPEVFRMKLDVNTREAAVQLVEDCMDYIAPEGDPADPDDRLHDPFLRACELNAELNGTHYRKSDDIACTAAVRLAECGCGVLLAAPDLATALAPPYRLGFPLGGWEGRDALPAGCRYADVENGSHTIVTCDLTALEVLDHADELKAHCQTRYADDVVVYVPVPWQLVSCEPPADETYAGTCTEHPWAVQP
jgi:hypothetical protein